MHDTPQTDSKLEKQAELLERVVRRTGFELSDLAERIGLKEQTLYKARRKLIPLSAAVLKHLEQLERFEAGTSEERGSSSPVAHRIFDYLEYIVERGENSDVELVENVLKAHYEHIRSRQLGYSNGHNGNGHAHTNGHNGNGHNGNGHNGNGHNGNGHAHTNGHNGNGHSNGNGLS